LRCAGALVICSFRVVPCRRDLGPDSRSPQDGPVHHEGRVWMAGLSETIDVLKGSVGAHHEPTSSSQNVKRGSSKCSAVPLASPTLRGYSSSMAAVYDRDPRWECAELKGCTGHIRTRSHRRICHCYCFNMFQYVSCCFLCVDMCGTITLKYHSLVGSC
jgi:hypothetical protein